MVWHTKQAKFTVRTVTDRSNPIRLPVMPESPVMSFTVWKREI